MTWRDMTWIDLIHDKAHDIKLKTTYIYIYIQYIQLQSTYLKTSYIPQDTERCLFWVSDWGLLGFVARVVVFCAWAYTLGRAFLSGTAAGGGGAGGGAGSGEVCPTHWLGLGALWFCSCELWFTAFSSGRPGGELFFFFGLIGFHGSVRLEMILFASFPLNDTLIHQNRLVLFFIRWLIEP